MSSLENYSPIGRQAGENHIIKETPPGGKLEGVPGIEQRVLATINEKHRDILNKIDSSPFSNEEKESLVAKVQDAYERCVSRVREVVGISVACIALLSAGNAFGQEGSQDVNVPLANQAQEQVMPTSGDNNKNIQSSFSENITTQDDVDTSANKVIQENTANKQSQTETGTQETTSGDLTPAKKVGEVLNVVATPANAIIGAVANEVTKKIGENSVVQLPEKIATILDENESLMDRAIAGGKILGVFSQTANTVAKIIDVGSIAYENRNASAETIIKKLGTALLSLHPATRMAKTLYETIRGLYVKETDSTEEVLKRELTPSDQQ
jgi:hypothetical protein